MEGLDFGEDAEILLKDLLGWGTGSYNWGVMIRVERKGE